MIPNADCVDSLNMIAWRCKDGVEICCGRKVEYREQCYPLKVIIYNHEVFARTSIHHECKKLKKNNNVKNPPRVVATRDFLSPPHDVCETDSLLLDMKHRHILESSHRHARLKLHSAEQKKSVMNE